MVCADVSSELWRPPLDECITLPAMFAENRIFDFEAGVYFLRVWFIKFAIPSSFSFLFGVCGFKWIHWRVKAGVLVGADMKERVTKIFFERRTWSFWPFFCFFCSRVKSRNDKKTDKDERENQFFHLISFETTLFSIFFYDSRCFRLCVCVVKWPSGSLVNKRKRNTNVQSQKRQKRKRQKKKRFIVRVRVCVRRCRDRQIIMWSGVMVSLSSSVPVVKMEGLVKLCAESLHFVLLGLCTR